MFKNLLKRLYVVIWLFIFISVFYCFTLINNGSPIEIPEKEDFIQDIKALTKNNDESIQNKIEETEQEVEIVQTYLPIKISIPRIRIDLRVEIGGYDETSRTWTIGNATAYWANLSDLLSKENGNTLIYAHNTWDAFYPLKDIKMGDYAYLTAETGETLTYEFFDEETVDPNDDSLFSINDTPRLTLLTCNGSFSQVRRLMYFRLIEIQ
ncbi:MAG: class F sortase [bacterium]